MLNFINLSKFYDCAALIRSRANCFSVLFGLRVFEMLNSALIRFKSHFNRAWLINFENCDLRFIRLISSICNRLSRICLQKRVSKVTFWLTEKIPTAQVIVEEIKKSDAKFILL